ncbi:MAG: glycoside hydrolase family 2 TIM barrel-domain containing protein [Fusicatenibacter sp.]
MTTENRTPEREYELMDGWRFARNSREKEAFRPVTLPHDWGMESPFEKNMEEGEAQGFRDSFGVGWYQKDLELTRKKSGFCYLLYFGGIYENSTVWVNGIKIGGRKYGYSSFTLDATEALREGSNLIEVKVDHTNHPSDRWYSGAGIYRTVKLLTVEKVHLDPWEVVVHTEFTGNTARICIDTGLKGRTVQAVLKEENGLQSFTVCGSSERLEFVINNAKRWSAQNPNLYGLTLTLMDGERVVDQIWLRIGLRELSMVPDQGMFVNGVKVILKGVCIHQDTGCAGIASRKEMFRKRLMALKEAGCNAIRAAHHTYSEEFLDLCDEMGFYVYEECFDKWHGGLYGRYFETEWQRDVDAMVKRDRNHPCIVFWGVGNEVENQGQNSMLKTLKLLTDYVRKLDRTRPVSYAMNPHFKRESNVDLQTVKDIQKFVDEVSDTEIYENWERVERIAKIAEYVDVISCNYQEQWYAQIHEQIPDKLILGTEIYQYFMGDEQYMQNFTEQNPSLVPYKLPYVIGGFIWTGIDYLGESMGYPSKGWCGSLIRTNGSRRPGYYVMQSYWSEKPMVRFFVMDYSLADEGTKEHWDMPMLAEHWHFPQFQRTVIPYRIVSNCEEVRLFLNEKEIKISKPEECENRIITGFLPWQSGTVKVIGYQEGREVCRHVVHTPGMAVRLNFLGDAWIGKAEIEKISVHRGYQMQLTVQACDAKGHPCFRESARTRFRVEGPAQILAVDAGDLNSHEPYQESAIHMYHGQASVLIALTGEAGRICIYADAEGMQETCQVLVIS